MPNVKVIQPIEIKKKNKKINKNLTRVCAYARVSTELENQETSYEAQMEYYTQKIQKNKDWEFVKVFADEGKSGTRTDSRDGFNEMIKMCEKGKIDLVITKSISRFARNTVDALQNIRKLKSKGIPIIFEKENINTMDNSGELLITILSSQAQEESRNISENIRWGIRRKYENGDVYINHKLILGYTKDKEGTLIIDKKEAEIVKRIYREYLYGKSYYRIAKDLTKDNIKTVLGSSVWWENTIKRILTNEKYIGDAMLQKTYTKDFLTKHRVENKGEVTSYYIEGNHSPIIPREIFNKVQEERIRRINIRRKGDTRKSIKSKYSSKYALSEVLKCAECGKSYRRQIWSKYNRKVAVWRCEDKLKNGLKSNCKSSPTVKEEMLHQTIMKSIDEIADIDNIFQSKLLENIIFVLGLDNAAIYKHNNLDTTNYINNDNKYIQYILDKVKKSISDIKKYNDEITRELIEYIKVYENLEIEIKLKTGESIRKDLDYYYDL